MRRRPSFRVALGVLLAVSAAVGPMVPAQADPVTAPSAGTPLPRVALGGTDAALDSAAPGYVIYSHGLHDEDDPVTGTPLIHRVSDNSVVRPRGDPEPRFFQASFLSGDLLLRYLSHESSLAKSVVAEDIETGAVRWRVDGREDDVVYAATAGGMLVRRAGGLRLLRPDGRDELVVPEIGFDSEVLARDPRTIVCRDGERLFAIDLPTGTERVLQASGTDRFTTALLGPTRISWFDLHDSTVAVVRWQARDGGSSGTGPRLIGPLNSLVVVGYGDRVARLVGDPTVPRDLVEVQADGALGATLVRGVVETRPLGDGSVAVLQAPDPIGSRLSVLSPDGSTRVLTDFGPRVAVMGGIATAGTVTYADVQRGDGMGGTQIRRLEGGSTTWTPTAIGGVVVEASGTTVVSHSHVSDSSSTVTTRSGSYRVADHRFVLGGGGELAAVLVDETGHRGTIRLAEDGSTIGDVPEEPWALDGGRVWTLGRDGRLTGRDLLDGSPALSAHAPTCPRLTSLQVSGRWALLQCYEGPSYAVDLRLDETLTLPELGAEAHLGAGFVASTPVFTPGRQVVQVLELGGLRRTRDYGPVHAIHDRERPKLVVDTSGARRLLFVDGQYLPVEADLSWVTETPDSTAPRLLSATATPGPTAASTTGFSWSYRDAAAPYERASGVTTYDVRARVRPVGGAFGPYGQTTTTETSIVGPATPGAQTCWQVRSRDSAGNTSDWSPERCTLVDGAAPRVVRANVGATYLASTAAAPATFSVVGADDVAVAGYDIGVRVASPGKRLGPLTLPASWQGRASGAVSLPVAPGGQACFTARVRDAVGRVSAWWAPRCVAVLHDDARLTPVGAITRTRSSLGLGGTLTRLDRPGAQLSVAGQSGRRLALSALTGPGQGVVDVLVGGTRVGRLDLSRPTTQRQVLLLPGGSGTVVVRAVRGRALVDAVGPLRD